MKKSNNFVEIMLSVLSFFSILLLFLRALLKNWIPIIIGAFILILIFKYVDTVWLKWFLAVMIGGAFFYSIYDDIALFVDDEAWKAVEKLDPEARERVMKKHRERINKQRW